MGVWVEVDLGAGQQPAHQQPQPHRQHVPGHRRRHEDRQRGGAIVQQAGSVRGHFGAYFFLSLSLSFDVREAPIGSVIMPTLVTPARCAAAMMSTTVP